MKKSLILIWIAGGIFFNHTGAMAHGDNEPQNDLGKVTEQFRRGGKKVPGSVNGAHHHFGSTSSGGHSHQPAPPVDSPPNYKVLGVFGMINLSFILIGAWQKFSRRKGNAHGHPGKKAKSGTKAC